MLLAVQPSSLTPEEMDNFVAAVKSGQPTAIFEDPFPLTAAGRRGHVAAEPPGGRPDGACSAAAAPPKPKGDISKLWKLLGVEMYGDEIVWQEFNPEPKLGDIFPEWIFIDESLASDDGAFQPFAADDQISAGMKQLLFFWAGSFRPANNSKLEFKKLAVTGRNTGTVSHRGHRDVAPIAQHDGDPPRQRRTSRTSSPPTSRARSRPTRACISKTPPKTPSRERTTQSDAKKDDKAAAGEAASAAVGKSPKTRTSTSCSSPTSIGSRRTSSAFAKWATMPIGSPSSSSRTCRSC